MKIKQEYTYTGDDYQKWAVWIDAPDAELNTVERVEYTLHPSFPKPVRIIEDRKTNFRLETAGWGVFTVYAKAVLQDGKKIDMEHELELFYDDGTQTFA